jgi:hypothetical protein
MKLLRRCPGFVAKGDVGNVRILGVKNCASIHILQAIYFWILENKSIHAPRPG